MISLALTFVVGAVFGAFAVILSVVIIADNQDKKRKG